MSLSKKELSAKIKAESERLGFVRSGICSVQTPPKLQHFYDWLDCGYAGEMEYLQRRAEAYSDPTLVLEDAKSLVMLLYPYRTVEPQPIQASQGRVSRYAWGTDYHDVIRKQLHQLADYIREINPKSNTRGVVDTAPLLEREFAQLAGLGWIGKNTLLLNREWGSWFFLAAILLDVELEYDEPFAFDHCGTCTACLDACPTDAFVDAYVLDSRKCISYLTIELRNAIPEEHRTQMGDWLFGCDVCQDVCPWNHKAPIISNEHFLPKPELNPVDLHELFFYSEDRFREIFKKTPLWRAKRRGILRNAAIVMGNQQDQTAEPALLQGITDHEPLIRGASAWAWGEINSPQAKRVLQQQLEREEEQQVLEEIHRSLQHICN